MSSFNKDGIDHLPGNKAVSGILLRLSDLAHISLHCCGDQQWPASDGSDSNFMSCYNPLLPLKANNDSLRDPSLQLREQKLQHIVEITALILTRYKNNKRN